jgi:hypothetical protein
MATRLESQHDRKVGLVAAPGPDHGKHAEEPAERGTGNP